MNDKYMAMVDVFFFIGVISYHKALSNPKTKRKSHQHLTREEYKDYRFKLMIPKLRMKKVMYTNHQMLSNQGDLLAIISDKKANWYVAKELADRIDESTIKLRFTAKGKPPDFTRAKKTNSCVCCGKDTDGYMRHFIVPKCYKQLFPMQFKSHLSHDIVILCPQCNREAGRRTDYRMKCLDRQFRDPKICQRIVDKNLVRVRSMASALLCHAEKMPPAVLAKYTREILDYYSETVLTDELLRNCAEEDKYGKINKDFVEHADLIYENLCQVGDGDSAITDFIKTWRKWFIQDMKPRHMPEGWSIDSNIRNTE